MPRKKTATAGKTQSKADFVRTQPDSMGAKDVVKAAAKAGIQISEAYVYTIRYEAKRRGKKKPGRPKGSKNRGSARAAAPGSSVGVEEVLKAAAAEIGLSRAISLLQDQQRALRSVLGG